MPNTTQTVEVLNDLILINNDRISGYEKAIKDTRSEDDDLKIFYASMIAESHRNKIALATEVQALGADVMQGTTAGGKIYRAWMDVRAMFSGHDRHHILANCEAVEDAVQRAYRMALEHDIPAYIHELFIRQQQELKEAHDEIKSLRDQYA
jgi:uncharacterized protein (TIGR02284 family)